MSGVTTLLRVHLEVTQRWAVGGVDSTYQVRPDSTALHLPVLVDPLNKEPYVPGTSLAGSLRVHLGERASQWLGTDIGSRERSVEAPIPSRLWIKGVLLPVSPSGTEMISRRGRTAVDPHRGAALGGSLRVEQSVAPTSMVVVMEHEGIDEELRALLACWTPTIGRGRSLGMGRAHVTAVEYVVVDRAQPGHLTWWLTGRHDWCRTGGDTGGGPAQQRLPGSPTAQQALPDLTWGLITTEPLHVGTEKAPPPTAWSFVRKAQRAPLFKVGDAPVVPGSSWKGIFRHRVGLILRCLDLDAPDVEIVVARLFGSPETGLGALIFGDTTVHGHLGKRTHVAIDRFTGGAADGLLFEHEVVEPGARVTLSVGWARDAHPPEEVVTLLRHVITDLQQGLMGVGGGAGRGYGSMTLTDDTWSGELTGVDPAALARWASSTAPQTEDS